MPPLLRALVAAGIAFVLVSDAGHVAPASAEPTGTRAAKRHYDRGETLFALGKFDQALEEYEQAFDAKPLPDFLYNIGQCYRNLGDLDQAIFSFKKYLKLAPDASDREKVEKLIDDLEERRARGEGKKFIEPQPEPQPTPTPRTAALQAAAHHTPIYKTWWFWTSIAVVGMAGGVGIYEGVKSSPPSTDLGNIDLGK